MLLDLVRGDALVGQWVSGTLVGVSQKSLMKITARRGSDERVAAVSVGSHSSF